MQLPRRAEVRDLYAQRTRLELSQIAWYEAFARWKMGDSKDPRMESIAARVPALAISAANLLDEITAT
jgi:hypothetical protein